ncbi:MAG: YgiQ family radical SAM protein [Methanomethylophilus sp.]|jgi:uncharacterized radical SAM protein YgiQ
MSFIPTLPEEVSKRGWDALDIVIVSGDTYIDSPYNGAAIIGHWLIDNGFRVGIVCQPDVDSEKDIMRLGKPKLFWSVTAGCVDSIVANHSPTGKFRKEDDFTPGGRNDRRPDRACIAYSNLIRRYSKGVPIVLGGIEASLRRISHYDYLSDSIRRSVLFDAKADAITYGMAELSNLELAQCLRDGKEWHNIRGICYASKEAPDGYIEIPPYEDCAADKKAFASAFRTFYANCDPVTAKGLVQKHGDRFLVQNPPQRNLTPEELDRVYMLDYEYAVHPLYAKQGKVRAMDTIKNSITTHRGCYGECSFCAIAVHQGRAVVSRTEDSIVEEAKRLASRPGFNGIIYDVGGPTADMYGIECARKAKFGACPDKKCLWPEPCRSLPIDHSRQIALLRRISEVPGVKRVFVASGIRYDMVVADKEHGREYLDEIVGKHTSGQLKIAPEHVSERVLACMGKPKPNVLLDFRKMFVDSARKQGKDEYLTYYFIAAHPGCRESDMRELADFCHQKLKTVPEQVQVFTPTPSTVSTMMYWTGEDMDGNPVWSEHVAGLKLKQKQTVVPPKDGSSFRKGDFKKR